MHGPETLPRLRDVGNKVQGKLQTLRVTTQNHRIDSSPSSATLVLPFQVTQLKRLEAPVAMAQGALKVANSLLNAGTVLAPVLQLLWLQKLPTWQQPSQRR